MTLLKACGVHEGKLSMNRITRFIIPASCYQRNHLKPEMRNKWSLIKAIKWMSFEGVTGWITKTEKLSNHRFMSHRVSFYWSKWKWWSSKKWSHQSDSNKNKAANEAGSTIHCIPEQDSIVTPQLDVSFLHFHSIKIPAKHIGSRSLINNRITLHWKAN